MEKRASERELEKCIDSLLDEMNSMYCTDLVEEQKIDAKIRDIKFRDELISEMKDQIRCRKLSERIMAEQLKSVVYQMTSRISSCDFSYSIERKDSSGNLLSK